MSNIKVKAFLESNRGWQDQRAITRGTGVSGPAMRRLCQEHPQTYISSGAGYKLARHASINEINDSVRVLLSRSEKIMHRARSLQRLALERTKAGTRRTNPVPLRAVS